MTFQKQDGHIFYRDQNGEIMAEICFPTAENGVVQITRTFVDPSLRGQGIAGKLMQAAAEQIRAACQKARPVCPYAAAWFDKHPDQQDILA